MDLLNIEVVPGSRPGVRIFKLRGPFTLPGIFQFQSAFRSGGEPVTIIDLSEVPYMDSASVGSVVGVHTSSQRLKRKYALVGVSGRLRTLFEVAGVLTILTIYPTLEEAEARLAAAAAAN